MLVMGKWLFGGNHANALIKVWVESGSGSYGETAQLVLIYEPPMAHYEITAYEAACKAMIQLHTIRAKEE